MECDGLARREELGRANRFSPVAAETLVGFTCLPGGCPHRHSCREQVVPPTFGALVDQVQVCSGVEGSDTVEVSQQRFQDGAHLRIGLAALQNRRSHPRAGAVRRRRAPSPPVGLGRRGPPSTTSAWAVFGSPSAPEHFKHTKRSTVPKSPESVPP